MDTPVLWHIPFSHYSEKARWALDYKGIAHRRRVLGSNYLIRVWRATGQGKLPVLWLDGRAIADSTRIIAALEEHYPEPPLYPHEAAARQRALALEDDLDETLGPALRAAVVTPLFRHDPDTALRMLTTGMGSKAYPGLRPLLRVFPWFYRFRHKISERNLERDRAVVAAALDRIEHTRQGRAYLVGEAFTVASRQPRCWGRSCSLPRFSTRCSCNCRCTWKTTAPSCYSIQPCNGQPASTACIVDTPRKLPGANDAQSLMPARRRPCT
jgi:glutathione S-transferase